MTPPAPEAQQTEPLTHTNAAVASAAAAPAAPGLVQRFLEAQQRERDVLLSEFVKVRGLMPLLMKHRNGTPWSRAERTELQGQLRALAHLSPYLVILLLPGSFALLPVYAWWLDRRRNRGPLPHNATCRRQRQTCPTPPGAPPSP